MKTNITDKIKLAALAIPAFAEDLKITSETDQFRALETLSFKSMLSGAISLVLILVSVVFFFILVIGGLKWVTSGGDEKKVAVARAQITNALIGLAIVFAAWAIMQLIGTVFGINILDLTLPTFGGNG